jgi:hypothetical protein
VTVYLLHFDPPLKHARHYIGFTSRPVWERIHEHFGYHPSKGSRLVRAVIEAGHVVVIAHVWPDGDRTWERRLKKRKDACRWCPRCQGKRKPPEMPCEP